MTWSAVKVILTSIDVVVAANLYKSAMARYVVLHRGVKNAS